MRMARAPELMIRISGQARRAGRRRSVARARRLLIRAPRQAAGRLPGPEPLQSSGPPRARRPPARARWLVWIVAVLVASAVGGALGVAAMFGLAEIAPVGPAGSVFSIAVGGGMFIGIVAVPVADTAVQLMRSRRRRHDTVPTAGRGAGNSAP
jgi:fatty acid desaturase